jgi:hypothetical protein
MAPPVRSHILKLVLKGVTQWRRPARSHILKLVRKELFERTFYRNSKKLFV